MKFSSCCYFDEKQLLPLLSPGASGQPARDSFKYKNTHKHAIGIEILCFYLDESSTLEMEKGAGVAMC